MSRFPEVQALTFDLFGTVLDLAGSLTPHVSKWLRERGSEVSPLDFWAQWRARQRIEQYQDTITMLGHSGYLETARRALVYTLRRNGVSFESEDVTRWMESWRELNVFAEVHAALERLKTRYRLVALSNGDEPFLGYLVEQRIGWSFDRVISVDLVGAFKPHPAVYRRAALVLGLNVSECLMVSANSFDCMGYRAAFVNRDGLPFEDSPFQPDVTVGDFTQLAEELLNDG
jgi:2-haloacid dehalogenase